MVLTQSATKPTVRRGAAHTRQGGKGPEAGRGGISPRRHEASQACVGWSVTTQGWPRATPRWPPTQREGGERPARLGPGWSAPANPGGP